LLIFSIFTFLFSCTKKELVGDEITSASASLTVNTFSFSKEEVDFSKSQVFFNAEFSEEVTAKIELVGQESGAKKEFSFNLVSKLNIDNSIWLGEHDDLTFFRKNENVVAKLSFYGHDQNYYDTLLILDVNKFSDGASVFSFYNNGVEDEASYDSWSTYNYGSFLDRTLSGRSEEIIPVQGDYSYRLINLPNSPSGYLGGGDFALKENQKGFAYLSDNPEDVWFNCYVYSSKKSSGNIIISFAEADGNSLQANAAESDNVNLVIPLDFEGWKLISQEYTKIPFATIPEFGGNGNKEYEPNKIEVIAFQIESTVDDEMIDVAFDNFIFTIGKPFQ